MSNPPQHIGIIMDGNRRWAKEKGLPTFEGHRRGYNKIKEVIGVILILIGLAALFTPLTPGSWLLFIGLELLGLRILLSDKLLKFWKRK